MKLHKLRCGSNAPYLVESPEEIANYLKERAKHYPTRTNLERKEREKRERLEKLAELRKLDPTKEGHQQESGQDNDLRRRGRFQRGGKFQRGGFQRYGKRKFSSRDQHDNDRKGKSGNLHLKATPLLQKLLSKEMEEEQDVILECLSYFVKNNFFLCSEHTSQEQQMQEAESGCPLQETKEEIKTTL